MMAKANVVPATPSRHELMQESRRQCVAAAKDLDIARSGWREAVEDLSKVQKRIEQWKAANSDYEQTHPELVRLANERKAVRGCINHAAQSMKDAQERWKKSWNDVCERNPRPSFCTAKDAWNADEVCRRGALEWKQVKLKTVSPSLD
ncbi:hypothetical protein Ae201684P_011501 [Aphanomyces euteiches]|uniref:Uncharacterized protein n=1 Tax=Aphanomyces euteiches TaxID=100861 RepID=A0A6G0XWN4_9STRA|nr:hypothetical protein Ae201684_000688 [Aphanomyces euteiches]KAH9091960.1 hypothetical protein Ae201684P_011501 [Aphanomyces euteiches]KAH9157141.1 hypothetical protein AeRB84_001014 [Aphanomyces euteiches]